MDLEGELYRKILASNLKHESHFKLSPVQGPLTSPKIREIVETCESKYILFISDSHQLSNGYVNTVLEYLEPRNVYLAEPFMYTGKIPADPTKTTRDQSYFYTRDTDIYGSVYNTRRLLDLLNAATDLDRTAIYIAYRLYWSIAKVTPLPIGYSVATNIKAAIGVSLEPQVSRLIPLISTKSTELRTYIIRYLAIYLRGLRASKSTGISVGHIRDLVSKFSLKELIPLVQPLQAFEAAWIKSFEYGAPKQFIYKQLTNTDVYLRFDSNETTKENDVSLYEISFADILVKIIKSYESIQRRESESDPSVYDYYSRPISEESTIIFFDRPMQADDNAEYLYEFFTKTKPEYQNAYFALRQNSRDWERLEKKGFKLIPIFTKEFYELFLESDLVVSSQIYNLQYHGKNLSNSRFVYLQHGIQLNDMSDWIVSKHFDLFIATGRPEADYLKKYAPIETVNFGLPRLESLTKNKSESRHMLFAPTWRFNLNNVSTETFIHSEYFQAINGLMTDPKLIDYLEQNEITLNVKLHPNVESRASLFNFSARVVNCPSSYREAISSADFVFTDYSSVVLDAAFIGIPIAYYQWDFESFFEDQPYSSRVDYNTDGLGPVFETIEEVSRYLITDGYRNDTLTFENRRDQFFEGIEPKRINSRIVDRMLSL